MDYLYHYLSQHFCVPVARRHRRRRGSRAVRVRLFCFRLREFKYAPLGSGRLRVLRGASTRQPPHTHRATCNLDPRNETFERRKDAPMPVCLLNTMSMRSAKTVVCFCYQVEVVVVRRAVRVALTLMRPTIRHPRMRSAAISLHAEYSPPPCARPPKA